MPSLMALAPPLMQGLAPPLWWQLTHVRPAGALGSQKAVQVHALMVHALMARSHDTPPDGTLPWHTP